MHILYNLLFLAAAIKWGDWKNWRTYYPTWLFFVGGDLFKNALLHDHLLWSYKETIFGTQFLLGHFIIDIVIMLFAYSSTLLIYLGNFPKQRFKQVLWILFWVVVYSSIEFINRDYLHLIEHHYGWNMYWSIVFNILMFSVLKLHVKRPIAAWLISILALIVLLRSFDIPMESFK